MGSFRHNLGSLLRFSGRSSLGQFWPYALTVVLIATLVFGQAMAVVLTDAFARMQRFAKDHPELVTETRGPGSYSIEVEGFHPELMPDLRPLFVWMAIVAVALVLLLAASVARRLHDRGWSGWWGLAPLPFLAAGLVFMPQVMTDPERYIGLFFLLFLNNFVYLAALVALIVLLSLPGTLGPNRYGPPPE
jgi:uncharacterized membrane protein YhaH (DUF805 family)